MGAVTVTIRRGGPADAGAAAEVWLRARREGAAAGTIPAPVHDDDDVRGYFGTHVVEACELWLAEQGTGVAGLLVLHGEWLEHLYVEPGLTGHGIGSRLLEVAKRERPDGLRLWTFAANAGRAAVLRAPRLHRAAAHRRRVQRGARPGRALRVGALTGQLLVRRPPGAREPLAFAGP